MPATVYELRARSEKVRKLVAVLDAHLLACDVHPYSARAAEVVADFGAAVWLSAARIAGCNQPSEQTVAEVVKTYRGRPEHVAFAKAAAARVQG